MLVIAASNARGVNLDLIQIVKNAFENTALTNVTLDDINIPMGWEGRVGELVLNNFGAAMAAMGTLVAPFMDVDMNEYERLRKEIIDGFKARKSWFKAPYGFGMKKLIN